MTKIINGAKNYLAMKRTLASALVAYLLLGVSTGVSAESMTFACKEIHAQDKHTFKYSRLGLPEQHIRIDLGKSQVIMNEQMWFPVRSTGQGYVWTGANNDRMSINRYTGKLTYHEFYTFSGSGLWSVEFSCKRVKQLW